MSVPDRSIDPRLLASAEAEFLKNGFLKAELKTICENADITTGAVYKRYKGKEDLFCAVVEDVAGLLVGFVQKRSAVDFSALSDEEIYRLWIMTYDSMIPMFKLLYEHRDKFTLLIDKAAGTRYENFSHEYVLVPIMMSTVRIADELSAAYLTKGLSAGGRRTHICRIRLNALDILMIAGSFVMIVLFFMF